MFIILSFDQRLLRDTRRNIDANVIHVPLHVIPLYIPFFDAFFVPNPLTHPFGQYIDIYVLYPLALMTPNVAWLLYLLYLLLLICLFYFIFFQASACRYKRYNNRYERQLLFVSSALYTLCRL